MQHPVPAFAIRSAAQLAPDAAGVLPALEAVMVATAALELATAAQTVLAVPDVQAAVTINAHLVWAHVEVPVAAVLVVQDVVMDAVLAAQVVIQDAVWDAPGAVQVALADATAVGWLKFGKENRYAI